MVDGGWEGNGGVGKVEERDWAGNVVDPWHPSVTGEHQIPFPATGELEACCRHVLYVSEIKDMGGFNSWHGPVHSPDREHAGSRWPTIPDSRARHGPRHVCR